MATHPFPQHYPGNWGNWIKTFLKWLWTNVILGLLALLISGILILVSKGAATVPSELALSLVVLTMTLAANGMDALEDGRVENRQGVSEWLRPMFILFLIFGAVLAAISTPSSVLVRENVDQLTVGFLCVVLLILVVPFSFFAHALSLKGRDAEVHKVIQLTYDQLQPNEEFLQHSQEREDKIKAIADGQGNYKGVKL